MTAAEYLSRAIEAFSAHRSAQADLCLAHAKAFAAGEPLPELAIGTPCNKCGIRPHLPYGPFCGPCESIARDAYNAAPAAIVEAP